MQEKEANHLVGKYFLQEKESGGLVGKKCLHKSVSGRNEDELREETSVHDDMEAEDICFDSSYGIIKDYLLAY